jgi:hypothetical protein
MQEEAHLPDPTAGHPPIGRPAGINDVVDIAAVANAQSIVRDAVLRDISLANLEQAIADARSDMLGEAIDDIAHRIKNSGFGFWEFVQGLAESVEPEAVKPLAALADPNSVVPEPPAAPKPTQKAANSQARRKPAGGKRPAAKSKKRRAYDFGNGQVYKGGKVPTWLAAKIEASKYTGTTRQFCEDNAKII